MSTRSVCHRYVRRVSYMKQDILTFPNHFVRILNVLAFVFCSDFLVKIYLKSTFLSLYLTQNTKNITKCCPGFGQSQNSDRIKSVNGIPSLILFFVFFCINVLCMFFVLYWCCFLRNVIAVLFSLNSISINKTRHRCAAA